MRPNSRALVVFLVSIVWASLAAAAITFQVTTLPTSLDSGDGTQIFALADVNKDGRLDILGINNTTDGFDVFLNDGSGGFSNVPSVSVTVGAAVIAIASGDFDGDGNPDVVLVDTGADMAIFLFGDGTGHFGNEVDVDVSSGPVAVTVADLNNDNIVDAAVLSDTEISLIRNNGDRTFKSFAQATVGTKSMGGSAITSGFLNGNSFPDLVVTNDQPAGTVSVLLGNGNGTFKAAHLYNVGADPQGLVVAKLNSDSGPDIAAVDNGESADLNVSLLYGNNDGTFTSDQRTTAGALSVGVAAADFDHDGRVDLAVSNVSGGFGVVTLRNDPQCSACTPPACNCTNGFDLLEIQGFGDAETIRAGDLNGDGKPDIVAQGSDGSLGVFLNTTGQTVPTGTPANTSTRTPTPTSSPASAATSTPTPVVSPTPPVTAAPTGTSVPTPPFCTGDCDGSGNVTVNELILMVDIALDTAPLSGCQIGDADGSGDITVNEIIRAVEFALTSCPGSPG